MRPIPDLRDRGRVRDFFRKYSDLSGVIHFAASKAVGESVEEPLLYYENNLTTLVSLLQELEKKEKAHFIFSSSCTVYGQADTMPITEDAPVKLAESPYGNTKQIGEEIIRDTCKVRGHLQAIALRYFNPIGAHPSARIGELPLGVPQNLVPFITQTAVGIREQLSVFGDDYPTPDGTGVRDYIHVEDLASAHLKALDYLRAGGDSITLNCGYGHGYSVREVLDAVAHVNGEPLVIEEGPRRAGDPPTLIARADRVRSILDWTPEYDDLETIVTHSLAWERKLASTSS